MSECIGGVGTERTLPLREAASHGVATGDGVLLDQKGSVGCGAGQEREWMRGRGSIGRGDGDSFEEKFVRIDSSLTFSVLMRRSGVLGG